MGNRTWTDDDLRQVLPKCGSLRELCRALGLAGHASAPGIVRRAGVLGLSTDHLVGHPQTPRAIARKTSDEQLAEYVRACTSVNEVMRLAGYQLAGGGHAALSHRIRRLGLDTSHFLGQRAGAGKGSSRRKTPDEILVRLPVDSFREKGSILRRALLEVGVEERCTECEIGSAWNGKPLKLQVEHMDGDRLNCERQNLCFLCPNCHAQTDSWGRRPGDGAWAQRATVAPC